MTGTLPWSPTRVMGSQELVPSSAVFLATLTGNWIGSKISRTWTDALIWECHQCKWCRPLVNYLKMSYTVRENVYRLGASTISFLEKYLSIFKWLVTKEGSGNSPSGILRYSCMWLLLPSLTTSPGACPFHPILASLALQISRFAPSIEMQTSPPQGEQLWLVISPPLTS